MRTFRSVAMLAGILWCLFSGALSAAESVRLRPLPAPEGLFEKREGAALITPEPGQVVVVGRVDDGVFAIENIDQVTMAAPDGRRIALNIEAESIRLSEFDEIVSLRYFFSVRAEEIAAGGTYEFQWGRGVRAANRRVGAVVFDAAHRASFREMAAAPAGSPAARTQLASVEVEAVSGAEYYFLWYLLPMALIFVILTMRKIYGSHGDDSTAA